MWEHEAFAFDNPPVQPETYECFGPGEFDDEAPPPPANETMPPSKKRVEPNALFWFPPALQDQGCVKKPQWVPDEAHENCQNRECNARFDWLVRKHHCRLCGRIFCDACSDNYTLLPFKEFQSRDPQRTCRPCFVLLRPLQREFQENQSNAKRLNTLDESSSIQRYLNAPLAFTLGGEIRKASYSLTNLIDGIGTRFGDDQDLHKDLFAGADAVIFLTVAKVAFLGGLRFGTGLVVSRIILETGEMAWSAPCAVALGGLTVGVQFGVQVVDMIIPLHGSDAIAHFSPRGGTHALIGSECSLALGPLGRSAEASLLASESGVNTAMSYSYSRGLYGGITLDGAVCRVRDDVNRKFYGYDVEPRDLFDGARIPPPWPRHPCTRKWGCTRPALRHAETHVCD